MVEFSQRDIFQTIAVIHNNITGSMTEFEWLFFYIQFKSFKYFRILKVSLGGHVGKK